MLPGVEAEEWRPVPGTAGYEVSDLGNVRSYRKAIGGNRPGSTLASESHPIATVRLARGVVASFQGDPERPPTGRLVAPLVLGAFGRGAFGKTHDVRYADGDLSNLRLSNLSWEPKRGRGPGVPSVSREKSEGIRGDRAKGMTLSRIAEKHGVCLSTVVRHCRVVRTRSTP